MTELQLLILFCVPQLSNLKTFVLIQLLYTLMFATIWIHNSYIEIYENTHLHIYCNVGTLRRKLRWPGQLDMVPLFRLRSMQHLMNVIRNMNITKLKGHTFYTKLGTWTPFNLNYCGCKFENIYSGSLHRYAYNCHHNRPSS